MQDVLELRVGGASVAVRRNPRARRLRLRVDELGAAHLTLPPRTSLRAARSFLDTQQEWLARALGAARTPGILGLDEHGAMRVLGERLPIRYEMAPRATVRAGATLVASGPSVEAGAAALERWAKRQVLARAQTIAAQECVLLDLDVPRISVRAQRARWGSASAATRTLALNWRLLLTTEAALDYVVVHELCHFLEMNHSPRFWELVAGARPDWREQQRWLREHQAEVLRWSPLRALGG